MDPRSATPGPAATHLGSRWAVLAACLFVVGTNAFVIPGLLLQIAGSLRVTTTAAGYGVAVYAVVIAVAAPAISILLARWNRTGLLVVGLAMLALGTLVTAATSDLALFLAGRGVAALGGAAIIPTATAAGASLAPPKQRGRAIAMVSLGFSATMAVGIPVATAVGAVTGWRLVMAALGAIAVIMIPVLAIVVRRVPLGEPVPLGTRFRALTAPGVALWLVTTVLTVAGSNTLYVFLSRVVGQAGGALAIVLLAYGVAGVVGSAAAGPLTDRFGGRRAGGLLMAVSAAALASVAGAREALPLLIVVCILWGFAGTGIMVPVQHTLFAGDPRVAAVAVSWYTTAMYCGVALAPEVGGAVLSTGLTWLLPLVASAIVLVGFTTYQIGFRVRRRSDEAERGSASAMAEARVS